MDIEFKITPSEMGDKVRAILGVPEEILTDDIISSPVFSTKATKYINKQVKEYLDNPELDEGLLSIAYVYYISYLLCVGMDSRLPKQMDNLSTKTILQSINWYEKGEEILSKCNEIIDDVILEIDETTDYGNTFAVLTDASEYPNELI